MSKNADKNAKKLDDLIPRFLLKTFDMIECGSYSSYICWSQDGSSVVILNPSEFAEKILPFFFKHNNLASFIRQLNMYEFKKKKSKLSDHVFVHEKFQQGRRDLLKLIKRKNGKDTASLDKEKSDNSREEEESKVLNERSTLKNENSILRKVQVESAEKIKFLEKTLIEANQRNQEIMTQFQGKRNSEMLLKSVINQIACTYGPGAVQNILQAVRSRASEHFNSQPQANQSNQQQHQQINQPFYGNQGTSRPIYSQFRNTCEPLSCYQDGEINFQSDNFRFMGSYEFGNQYSKDSCSSDLNNASSYETPSYNDQGNQYNCRVRQQPLPGFQASNQEVISNQVGSASYQQFQSFSRNVNQVIQDKSSFISSEMSDDFKAFPSYL